MSAIVEPTIQEKLVSVQAQEDASVLASFDSDVAYTLGSLIRTHCQRKYPTRAAIVSIVHANQSQLLFFAASRPGASPDELCWVKRREATVFRWGMSTMRLDLQLQLGRGREETVHAALQRIFQLGDVGAYTSLGGGFPVRVKNVEGTVGAIVVSGLKQEDNHAVIVDAIQEYLGTQRNQ